MVVAAAGNVDHSTFAAECERLLGKVPPGGQPERQPPSFAASHNVAAKPLDQAHVVMTFAAPGYRDPDIYVLQVLSNILGGGMSSRLFQEVREKRGLCYSVFSYGSAYEDGGQIGVYAATSPEHSPDLLDVTSEVMLSVTEMVTEAEVARAKAQLKASLVMNLESASSRADQIARQFLAFGMVPSIATLTAKIDAVTSDQVRDLARRLFKAQMPAFSAVGHLDGLPGYEDIKRHFA
jgi:predicted Zn-dependent peptidase